MKITKRELALNKELKEMYDLFETFVRGWNKTTTFFLLIVTVFQIAQFFLLLAILF